MTLPLACALEAGGRLIPILRDLRDHNPNLPSALALLREPEGRDLRFFQTVGDR
jgi:hypothetical protein